MSRSINIDAPIAHVTATCAKRNLRVSAIESLHSGGTRVVTATAADTLVIAKAYGSKVITGPARRMPLHPNGL